MDINQETLQQFAIQGGTSWLKKKGITERFSKDERMVCKYLPRTHKIPLHVILKFDGISVDWILAVMEAGGLTLPGQDWRGPVRVALSKRLQANRQSLAIPPFDKIIPTLLEYQAEGGKLVVRQIISDRARRVMLHPAATLKQVMISKLILSICHESEAQSLVKSYHWLKMVLTTEERFELMGVQCYKKEDAAMKAAIILALITDNN